MTNDVRASGPLFDGRAAIAVKEYTRELEHQVAQRGEQLIRTQLGHVLRHPTGRYMSSISVQHKFGDSVVTDSGIVYGPWLEGTGSRNRTTRFKGYATFRRMRHQLDSEAESIGNRLMHHYLRRMQ